MEFSTVACVRLPVRVTTNQVRKPRRPAAARVAVRQVTKVCPLTREDPQRTMEPARLDCVPGQVKRVKRPVVKRVARVMAEPCPTTREDPQRTMAPARVGCLPPW